MSMKKLRLKLARKSHEFESELAREATLACRLRRVVKTTARLTPGMHPTPLHGVFHDS